MIKSILNGIPAPKFIVIEDTLEYRADKLVSYILQKESEVPKKILTFGGNFSKKSKKDPGEHYDFTQNLNNLQRVLSEITCNDVVVLDCISHLIFKINLLETYKFLVKLLQIGPKQVVGVVHMDLVENRQDAGIFLGNLSNLYLNIQGKVMGDHPRISFIHRKVGGKIIRDLEEFWFDGDELMTGSVQKPDNKKIEQIIAQDVEKLSTFSIGLTDDEKQSRNQVDLPFLPRKSHESEEGKIHYTMEAEDDWDEEDPDDDLDF